MIFSFKFQEQLEGIYSGIQAFSDNGECDALITFGNNPILPEEMYFLQLNTNKENIQENGTEELLHKNTALIIRKINQFIINLSPLSIYNPNL